VKRYKAGIVDDEQHGRDFIALLLANEFPEVDVAFRADGVDDARAQLQRYVPDLLFLDIELGDGTAFDLLPLPENLAARIIFITAYDHYAIRAIRNDAVDYILKPVRRDDFVTAVRKALRQAKLSASSDAAHLNLPTAHGFKRVAARDILRCEADSNYTMVYLSDKSKILVSKTLQEFESQLAAYGFFRVHHKHLINLAHFKQYLKGSGGHAVLSDGSTVPVSVRRKSDFLGQVKTHTRNS